MDNIFAGVTETIEIPIFKRKIKSADSGRKHKVIFYVVYNPHNANQGHSPFYYRMRTFQKIDDEWVPTRTTTSENMETIVKRYMHLMGILTLTYDGYTHYKKILFPTGTFPDL